MQLVSRKSGPVTFEHREDFTGDVRVTKGGVELTVSWEALELLIAEKWRADDVREILAMKPAEILRRRLRRMA